MRGWRIHLRTTLGFLRDFRLFHDMLEATVQWREHISAPLGPNSRGRETEKFDPDNWSGSEADKATLGQMR